MPTPVMTAPVMAMPADLGGRCDFILDRLGGTRIDQRHRLRALDRRGEDEQRTGGREATHFQRLHFVGSPDIVLAVHAPTRRYDTRTRVEL